MNVHELRRGRLVACAAGAMLAVALGVLAGCGNRAESPANGSTSAGPTAGSPGTNPPAPRVAKAANPDVPQPPSPFRFEDITREAGIDFVQVSGTTEQKRFPTANGSGLAIFDYDGDGRMDLYFLNGTYLPVGSRATGSNRLYRNKGDGTFEDVTKASGLGFAGYCHGVIVGDVDNDGDQDVFLATYMQNTFFRNNGDGTFTDVGREAGVAAAPCRGRVEAGGGAEATVVVDAVEGPTWRAGDRSGDDLPVKVRKGQRLVFRQADPNASRGLKLLAGKDKIQAIGAPEKPETILREVGASASRLGKVVPPAKAGAEPEVLAEFEVIREPTGLFTFYCAAHRPSWSSGGAVFDCDDDGDLDLYVTNYGEWFVETDGEQWCGNGEKGVRQYCSPKEVRTVKHHLYRNEGVKDGIPRFTDIYDEFLVNAEGKPIPGRADGHGFGVVAADLNGDGKIDLYVANDQNPAFTFYNQGGGKFLDATDASGAAYDESGSTQSGMGVDAEDLDGDGFPELIKTHFQNEYNTLYQNFGREGIFYDQTPAWGLAQDSKPWVGWGVGFLDFDNDGWPDVFVTNGHVDDNYDKLGQDVPYAEPALLHRNVILGTGPKANHRFVLATNGAGSYFEGRHVGRGAAFGDLDDDGRPDIAVSHKDGPPAVLLNRTPGPNRWVRLLLRGTKSNRDAIGARVEVAAAGLRIYRQRKGGVSMESSHDPRLLIGVGPAERVESITVRWPSGAVSVLQDVPTNQAHKVVEPTGTEE